MGYFPSVLATARGNTGGDVTAWNFTYPAGIALNDILILLVGSDGNPSFAGLPGNWAELKDEAGNASAHHAMVAWLRADGTETGAFSATSSAAESGGWQVYRIGNADLLSAPEISAGVNALGDPNPDALTPSWGNADTLWIAVGANDGNVSITGMSVQTYTGFINDRVAALTGAGVASATRQLRASSEDPPSMNLSGADDTRAYTIAVRPPDLNPGGRSRFLRSHRNRRTGRLRF